MVAQKIKVYKPETDTMGSLVMDLFTKPQLKMMIFLFVIFMALSNDIFINRILNKINGAVESINQPSTYGTVIQGIILVIGYICADILIRKGVV